MWVYTQARKSDGRMFVLDLTHLGVISVIDPTPDSSESVWRIEATNGTSTWVLAEASSHADAVAIQRRIFNSLATGEKAINLNATRRPME